MKKTLTLLAAAACLGTLQFCSSSKKSAAKKQDVAKVTFEGHVLPVLKTKCAPCHMPPDGKKKHYIAYDVVKTDVDDMIHRIQLSPTEKGFMPFKKTEKLPDSVIAIFTKWKADGLLEK
jgi:uncharacterized membrane protein